MAQRVYFDPTKPFEKRLLKPNQAQQNQQQPQQPDYVTAVQKEKEKEGIAIDDGLIQHSVKRVKKKINDYILINYQKLFFDNQNKENRQGTEAVAQNSDEQTLSAEDILSNAELLGKVQVELRLSDEQNKDPRELLQECLYELEEKGFLNHAGQKVDQYLYQIRDQREKLKHYISGLLKESQRGITFESIYRKVSSQFGNFFTKDFVFRIIDELF